jgi:hypothetical protein
MEIYKVHYQDRKYKNHEKLFVKLDKAKSYSNEITKKEVGLIYTDKNTRMFTKEEFENLKLLNESNKDFIDVFSYEYPIYKYKIKIFEDDIQTTKINYYYLQEEDNKIEEYKRSLDITITKLDVQE